MPFRAAAGARAHASGGLQQSGWAWGGGLAHCTGRSMATTAAEESTSSRWLLIDTDAGVDDAVAIAMAMKLSRPAGFVLKLLTTTHGNVALRSVNLNVAKVRRACGLCAADVPICTGAASPLLLLDAGKNLAPEVDAEYFHGRDGLGDAEDLVAAPPLSFAESPEHGISDEPAVDALLRVSQRE